MRCLGSDIGAAQGLDMFESEVLESHVHRSNQEGVGSRRNLLKKKSTKRLLHPVSKSMTPSLAPT